MNQAFLNPVRLQSGRLFARLIHPLDECFPTCCQLKLIDISAAESGLFKDFWLLKASASTKNQWVQTEVRVIFLAGTAEVSPDFFGAGGAEGGIARGGAQRNPGNRRSESNKPRRGDGPSAIFLGPMQFA
jgi:hypothetical protein